MKRPGRRDRSDPSQEAPRRSLRREILESVGFVLLAVAAWMVAPALGIAALGVVCLLEANA